MIRRGRMVLAAAALAAAIALAPACAIAEDDHDRALVVVVDARGRATVDGQVVDDDVLRARAGAYVAQVGPDAARAQIAADRRAPYSSVVHVIDVLRAGGVVRFAFATESEAR